MKNLYTLLILLSICQLSIGQCQWENGSFESWTLESVEIETASGSTVTNDVLLPDSSVSILRAFFMSIVAAFDPAIEQIFLDDPQGFIGISQSDDSSDGEFAIKLQGGYEVNEADIFSVVSCHDVPKKISVDIKHVGETVDTFSIIVLFDKGLQAIPEDFDDLDDVPAYAISEMVYSTDTEYETVELPIITNFAADVDTAYFFMVSITHDDSYFLVDNIQNTSMTTSTEDYTKRSDIHILSNPVHDELILELENSISGHESQFTILDMNGNILKESSGSETADVQKIGMSGLNSGMYVISAQSKKGIVSKVFVKI